MSETGTQSPTKRAKRHPGTVEVIGDYRRLILYCGGKRHTFKLETADAKAVAKFAREKHRELQREHDRRKKGVDTDTRFSGLLSQYVRDELPTLTAGTQRSYRDSFGVMEDYFTNELRDPTLDKIGAREIKGFLAWRRTQRRAGKHQAASAEPLSNRTLQKDRAVLHRVFDYADRLELREGNPVHKVKPPKADPRTPVLLSDEQYAALLGACESNPQLWLYTLTLAETGGRCISEALHLRWEDVDLAEGFIEIRSHGRAAHRTKSGKSRYVPMTHRLHAAMREHFARRRLSGSAWVFHHERARRGCTALDRVKTFRTAFDTAQKAAGIPDAFHRHDLRHRRVTTWLAEGKNAVHVKEALGHSDLRTTMGYTHLSKQHLRSLVDAPAQPTAVAEKHA